MLMFSIDEFDIMNFKFISFKFLYCLNKKIVINSLHIKLCNFNRSHLQYTNNSI